MAFSHAVRQQLRGNMRIPLSHQDWPVKLAIRIIVWKGIRFSNPFVND